MQFRLYPLRFSFLARDSIHFPAGKSSNLLRGAFGTIFRKLACVPQCHGRDTCEIAATCPYARMFEPSAKGKGPSGLAEWPRPFVFRATHLDGMTIDAGTRFSFDLNLFDMASPAIGHLVNAFSQLANEGLGPRRGRAELVDASEVYATPPMSLNLSPLTHRVDRVEVQFRTPTELKTGQQLAERPEFGVLAARIRDRISTLRECYDDGPLDIDFREFGHRASLVRMTRCEIEHVDIQRRSSRTGQVHPIGGFVGRAEYEGDLAEFVPYLRAARWTGVGRQTVWGKGELHTIC